MRVVACALYSENAMHAGCVCARVTFVLVSFGSRNALRTVHESYFIGSPHHSRKRGTTCTKEGPRGAYRASVIVYPSIELCGCIASLALVGKVLMSHSYKERSSCVLVLCMSPCSSCAVGKSDASVTPFCVWFDLVGLAESVEWQGW
jgi:hypothetical protein